MKENTQVTESVEPIGDTVESVETTDVVETVSKEEFESLVAERDELLQYKPTEISEAEQALINRENELKQKEFNLELKSNGLDKFGDFIKADSVDELKTKIEQFNALLAEYKVSLGYVPKEQNSDSAYEIASQNGDTKSMIGAKISKLFG